MRLSEVPSPPKIFPPNLRHPTNLRDGKFLRVGEAFGRAGENAWRFSESDPANRLIAVKLFLHTKYVKTSSEE